MNESDLKVTGSNLRKGMRNMQTTSGTRCGHKVMSHGWVGVSLLGLAAMLVTWIARDVHAAGSFPGILLFVDPSGLLATIDVQGSFSSRGPFFQSLGTNGRSCATCHVAANAWSITPPSIQSRFADSNGNDPLFRPVDGSNCPDSPGVTNSPPAESAYSLLLNKGLIRVSVPVPANAQFQLSVVYDPYGCAVTGKSGVNQVSVYRRPLPATNLRFLSAVMFDGRETLQPLNAASTFSQNLQVDLAHQALDATLGHAQAAQAPSVAVLQEIVDFELNTYTAQQVDNSAGNLHSGGSTGGPIVLSGQPYYPGINDSLGGNPTGAAFDPSIFTLFSAWVGVPNPLREAIARGEILFNTAPLVIQDVKGLNDALGKPVIAGTCGTCHDTPGVGNHSFPVPLDIGIAAGSDATPIVADALEQLNVPRLPLYAVQCSTSLGASVNQTVLTTDPGRALITGRCADIGKVKGPILRGLAARAPYFHNGAADTLEQVVRFYNLRFQMGLTNSQINDLVAFLRSL